VEKVVCLISGGIDSPVAGHIMIERGYEVVFFYCENSRTRDTKTFDRVKKLVRKVGGKALYTANHGDAMEEFVGKCDSHLRCLLCKRMMYRSAEKLAKKVDGKAIVTGENLGQVASQTLANMAVLDSVTYLPVLRPLLTMEKNETMAVARRIGTYDLSTDEAPGCPFVPGSPETQADPAEVKGEESLVDPKRLVEEVKLEKVF
jgi:thiamine biosynthesis protein ThiI